VQLFDNSAGRNEGRIARKHGSKKLYLDFSYHEVRIEKSTGYNDTPTNRRKVQHWLDQILKMKKDGTLEFAKLFPGASEEEKAFHTLKEKGEYPDPEGNYLCRL
jgi:integrase